MFDSEVKEYNELSSKRFLLRIICPFVQLQKEFFLIKVSHSDCDSESFVYKWILLNCDSDTESFIYPLSSQGIVK